MNVKLIYERALLQVCCWCSCWRCCCLNSSCWCIDAVGVVAVAVAVVATFDVALADTVVDGADANAGATNSESIHPKNGWFWWYITANIFGFSANFYAEPIKLAEAARPIVYQTAPPVPRFGKLCCAFFGKSKNSSTNFVAPPLLLCCCCCLCIYDNFDHMARLPKNWQWDYWSIDYPLDQLVEHIGKYM